VNIPDWPGETGRRDLVAFLKKVASLCFGALLLLTFMTPSWRYGPFTWLPVWRFDSLAGGPVELGLLNLLPLLLIGAWLSGRFLAWRWDTGRRTKWRWGRPGITLPLMGLTLLGLFTLDAFSPRRTFIYAGALALAWLVFLFMVNEKPRLTFVLAAVALVQGSVAIAQFLNQADLGIHLLGELPLNPIHGGISVLWARGLLWLRAYGLTAHPNLLGAILAAVLLLLLPAYGRARGRSFGLLVAFNVGLLGMLFAFSRAAGLAFVVGLIVWLGLEARSRRFSARRVNPKFEIRNPRLFLPLLIGAIFLLSFGDLAMSRVLGLDSPTEATSLAERTSAAEQAVDVIAGNILTGVGLGNYSLVAGSLFEGAVRVHNVPLLVTAELGILGLFFWLWLAVSPFWYQIRDSSTPGLVTRSPLHVWPLVLLIGLFDTTLWLTSNWQTAILFALIVALFAEDV
jgi:hypothetical protein